MAKSSQLNTKTRANRDKIVNLDHNKLLNYKSNEHVDWTRPSDPNNIEIQPKSLKIGTPNTNNYTEIDKTGLIKLSGDATVFDDMQVNVSGARVPAANYPTWRLYDFELAGNTYPVLGFSVNDYIDFYIETSHKMKLDTILDVHIHYTIPTAPALGDTDVKFQIEGVVAGIDEAFSAITTASTEWTLVAAAEGGHKMQDIANIAASNSTVSTIYILRLKMLAPAADPYTSEVYVLYVDCHFEIDTMGSRTETAK